MRLTMKFGGTSVGSGQRIREVAGLVHEAVDQGHQVVVIVSAMSGVTDALIKAARTAADGDSATYRAIRDDLLVRHRQVVREVAAPNEAAALNDELRSALDNLENLCRAIYVLGEVTPRAMDLISSMGERFTASLTAAALRAQGQPAEAILATELIQTDSNFGTATPLMDATREKTRAQLLPLLEGGIVPVVTGFMGATDTGLVTTLGRGGSDYSGSIIGVALDSDEVWIWTDVDGIMTADPRVVPDAQTLPSVSFSEAADLAYYGAKVLHPKSILPAVERGIPIRIKNTFNPSHPGTVVISQSEANGRTVKAITAIKGLSLVTVEGKGMLGVPGVAAKVFSAVADAGVNVLMISQSSSEQSICFTVLAESSARVIASLERAFEWELARRNIDRIAAQDGVGIVSVVGAGMKAVPGIAGKVFGALGQAGINVISIAQGSSEHTMSMVLAEADLMRAVQGIHAEFELGRPVAEAVAVA